MNKITTMREFFRVKFDAVEGDLNELPELVKHVVTKNGNPRNIDVDELIQYLEYYRYYWNSDKSMNYCDEKMKREVRRSKSLNNFIIRNDLDVKISLTDKAYYDYHGMSKVAYLKLSGGVDIELEGRIWSR